MKKEYSISIYLDERRTKQNGKYPVKLRVYCSRTKTQKLIQTKFEFTKNKFESIWQSPNPRGENKEYRLKLQGLENTTNDIAEKIIPFSIKEFERNIHREPHSGQKVQYHYKEVIESLNKNKRIKSAKAYKYSENKIKHFVEQTTRKEFKELSLSDIDKDWLEDCEAFFTNLGLSISTIGIVMRHLRAIFNKAIEEKEIEKEQYPFGKKKYSIPTTKGTKKTLSSKQLKTLYESRPETPQQEKAKDFWFFSFNASGINVKDIALLKYKDIDDDTIKFYRAKTQYTSKSNLEQITVYLNDYTKWFIKKYGTNDKSPDNYVFGILNNSMTAEQQQNKIENFTRFINQHIQKLCESINLPKGVSTYWARHSFATISIRNGASMEFMQESLGHKNMKTTQAYFDGFENETKKEFANKLMNF